MTGLLFLLSTFLKMKSLFIPQERTRWGREHPPIGYPHRDPRPAAGGPVVLCAHVRPGCTARPSVRPHCSLHCAMAGRKGCWCRLDQACGRPCCLMWSYLHCKIHVRLVIALFSRSVDGKYLLSVSVAV